VVVGAGLELVVVLVCIVVDAVLVSVTMPVGTDVVVVTLPAGAMAEAEGTSAEAVVSAIVVACETLFWRDAAFGMGTGTTVGSCDPVVDRVEPASEAALLREALAWEP